MKCFAACLAALAALPCGSALPGQDPVRTELPPVPVAARPNSGSQEPDRVHTAVLVPVPLPPEAEPMLDYARTPADEGAAARYRGSLARLSFVAGDWAPPAGERIDPELVRLAATRGAEEWLHAFVILEGQDSPARLLALRACGAEPIGFHPYSAYKVRLRPGAVRAVAQLGFVRWLGFARRWQRVAPELARVLAGGEAPAMVGGGAAGTLALFVTVFDSDRNPRTERFFVGEPVQQPLDPSGQWLTGRPARVRSNGAHEAALAATGAQVAAYHDDSRCFLVHATRAQVEALLDLDRVHYVEIAHAAVPDHDQSMPCTSQDEVRGLFPGGGEVIAGVIDSGVDRNHTDTNFFGQGWDLTGDNTPWTDIDGHGTHVAGTILGRGITNPGYKGAAPGLGWDGTHRFLNVRLYRGNGTPWGSALDAFDHMAAGGGGTPRAMVVNGSWHTSTDGFGTDAVSVDADAKAFADGILWVFAAGNRGDAGTINNPAAAKNVLAVANVQDEDGAMVNGNYVVFGNAAVGLRADTSSQGPAADGRWKPNLAAPGRTITSVQARTASSYQGLSGTSMAAPHVTGIAAGLMQHYPSLQGAPHFLGAKLMANAINRNGAFLQDRNQFGFGKVNAYRAHWSSDAPGGWIGGSGAVEIRPGVGATVDMREVPADCLYVYLLTWHLESAPSTGAGNAVKNNVDVYLDKAPYTAGTNTGEYASTNVLNNIETITLDASTLAGQVLRLKFHPTSIRAGETVKVGFQYCMLRGSRTPSATVSLTSDKVFVQPDRTFRLTAEIDCDSFFAANVLARLRDVPNGFQVQNMHLTLRDGTFVTRLMPQVLYQTLGDVRYDAPRRLVWDVKAPPYDYANAQMRTSFWASNVAAGAELVARGPVICVDGTAPTAVGNLESTSHPAEAWTNATRFTARWLHATDGGCAGLDGYSWGYALGAAPTPDFVVDTAVNVQSLDVVGSNLAHHFAVRALDRAGNGSTVRTHRFYVDTSVPEFSAFAMAGGITHTRSRLVSMDLTATDTFSGVFEMRFSNDGGAWSPWMPYQAQVVNWDLITGAGGSDARGIRTIYAEVRDRAGNTPPRRSAKVVWDDVPPGGEIRLANGSPFTVTPVVPVGVSFQDQHSALARMRFSNDGANWTPWEAYATVRPGWDLTGYGGGTGIGLKTVRCEVEDAAGNRSPPASAQIRWIGRPGVATVVPARTWTLRHPEEAIRLTGTGHEFLTEAVLRKGTRNVVVPLGSDWDARGRLVDQASDVESLLYLPKPIEPGTWSVALRNPAGESAGAALVLDVPPATSSVMDVPPTVRLGDPRGVNLVVAASAPLERGVLLLSTVRLPSVLPGIVELEIGNQFAILIDAGAFAVDPAARAWTLRLRSPTSATSLGARIYFEAALANGSSLPLATTNSAGVEIVQ